MLGAGHGGGPAGQGGFLCWDLACPQVSEGVGGVLPRAWPWGGEELGLALLLVAEGIGTPTPGLSSQPTKQEGAWVKITV